MANLFINFYCMNIHKNPVESRLFVTKNTKSTVNKNRAHFWYNASDIM